MKDFDNLPERDTTPSCEFKLGGKTWHCKAGTELPLNLVGAGLASDTTSLHVQVGTFFEGVLVESEVDDFVAMIASPRSPLTMSNAMPLMQWVTEQLVKRPTKRPASSRGGSGSTKPRSVASSSSRATPKRR
ncbi:MAG: hypothetical protein JWO62_2639 [Acidimicrobiaceae bacterium]|nr:hypothetical protein [Acidimicrobiaceae bacterium]